MTLPHRAPDLEELEVLDPQPITGEHSWRPSDHHSIFNSLDGTVLTFANNEVTTLIGCNAVMLEGDKSLAIYFDSFESPPEDYYDALSGEDYTRCFTDVDLSLDSFKPYVRAEIHCGLSQLCNKIFYVIFMY